MQKIAFVMQLKPGYGNEYKKRHDEIWPELSQALNQAGVSDYSIFLEKSSYKLFAVLKRCEDHSMDSLPLNPVVQEWWAFMADIMETNADASPRYNPLREVFHID